MVLMLKAYKYRLYPTESQKEIFLKHIGACRFTYNWALEQKVKAYETDKKH
jgi:putative transposase